MLTVTVVLPVAESWVTSVFRLLVDVASAVLPATIANSLPNL